MFFKDVMSLVPTSVSVLSCIEGGFVYGCTISSLISVDVRQENPEIVFVLKKQSLVGDKISTNYFFSINVLSENQDSLAKKYSTNRLPEETLDSDWKINNNFAELSNCRAILNCKLLKIYDTHAADIHVGTVMNYSGVRNQLPLIYDSRRYGKYQSI